MIFGQCQFKNKLLFARYKHFCEKKQKTKVMNELHTRNNTLLLSETGIKNVGSLAFFRDRGVLFNLLTYLLGKRKPVHRRIIYLCKWFEPENDAYKCCCCWFR